MAESWDTVYLMPVAAVMYVYIEDYRPDTVIAELAAELMQQFDLTDEDFPGGGPLVYMPREDYDLAHVVGELKRFRGFLLNCEPSRQPIIALGYERRRFAAICRHCGLAGTKAAQAAAFFYGADSTGQVISFRRAGAYQH